ncbi:hypothetical protein KIP69_15450 [Geobacter sulfurreducens]|uniref:DUF6484 domain-containing protein n=2 Tax=Geobacter sulfurreducens TaxID=35554 RepID=UPI0001D8F32D|nr:DUF6484 domain-containing protein [Geobacter sulfurreducens]ADI85927.1 hypothetical protein KN400_3115 [Geobacter sulfurreducens KN400]QVW34968.1 hypothetical protein KIP69_15450 [Geobacter sulfurreducens]UAC03838.1 hypothetical protein KVP06_15960 [Geobacter sulfurreducens]UTG92483.1 hypothetical protein J8622_15840 [Geobacter sulfurreducens]HBB70591.1 hypothetical protein [Geobacter sulfurreducens]
MRKKASAISFGINGTLSEGFRVGRIVSATDNRFIVDYPENSLGPIAARLTTSVKNRLLDTGNPAGKEILLAFENNDPGQPIIVDTMYSLLDEIADATAAETAKAVPNEVIVDGTRITFDAREEIELKCGKASIVLTSAGKVIIKGAYLLSQSSGENRIKGASVGIN